MRLLQLLKFLNIFLRKEGEKYFRLPKMESPADITLSFGTHRVNPGQFIPLDISTKTPNIEWTYDEDAYYMIAFLTLMPRIPKIQKSPLICIGWSSIFMMAICVRGKN